MTKSKYNVAVIGATGSVGGMLVRYLEERDFPINNIDAIASPKSVGKEVSFGDHKRLSIKSVDKIDYRCFDIVFMCAGSVVSSKEAIKAKEAGCIVIDKSSYFRLHPDVPLIVPEVNEHLIDNFKQGIIASPNCVVTPLAVALKPLDNVAKIKRLIISTYQSVSGAGRDGMDELYKQTKAKYIFETLDPQKFPTRIAFNLFPHVGDFRDDGYTDEEYKIEKELEKIMGPHCKTSVTCVRVPVFVSHSMSVNVEFENSINAIEAYEILSESDGVLVMSHENEIKYMTPVESTEHDEVFVSRIRDDNSRKNTINLWVVCDNLRKGAALNAVQIAEKIIQN